MPDVFGKLLDNVENKYYGKYRGTVSDNEDPNNLGRIKVKVPELLNDNVTGWALPCLPSGGFQELGFFFIPEKDSNVWVEFEGGNLSYPIWTGTWWGSDANSAPSESSAAQNNAGNNIKIIKTRSGHKIEFCDDKDDSKESILINSNGAHQILLDDSDGKQKILIQSNHGHNFLIDDVSDKIEIKTNKGVQIVMDDMADTITMQDSSGASSIKMDASSISIQSMSVSIKATDISIKADATVTVSGTASATLNSDAMVTIKGGMVMIN